MKKLLSLILCVLLLGSLAACNTPEPQQPTETTEETTPKVRYNYPKIAEPLTRESVNAFPIKSADMTTQEMRQLCADFTRFSKTALWTPDANVHYIRNKSGAEDDMFMGTVYAGLPYVGLGSGNVYRMLDLIDEETGVMDMSVALADITLFGNQCSICTYWGWGRVINSTTHVFTANMTHVNGYLRVGPYTYPDSVIKFNESYSTEKICQDNGMTTMFESYAQLHLADGLVNYTTAGHTLMASAEPHVEYTGGAIDPSKSYVLIMEQAQKWEDYTGAAGDQAQVKTSLDKKMTFLQLFNSGYIPFTYAEFLGTKPIDETQCSINLSGPQVDAMQLFSAKVTANFGISDVYITLKNAEGKEVYRLAVRASSGNVRTLSISRNATNAFARGDYDKLSGSYTAEVTAQLSTGECPVLYTGTVNITP